MGKSVWPGTQPSWRARSQELRLLALADDDLDAVVLQVERLALALDAVAEDGDRLRIQNLPQPFRRIIAAFHHGFRHVTDLDLAH